MKRQLSESAQVAKLCKTICKNLGVDARCRSSNFSMGSSVDINIVDVDPVTVDKLESETAKYQYGTFNGMIDLYEYSNRDNSIPQTKYLSVNNKFSDELKQKAWDFIKNNMSADCINDAADDYLTAQNVRLSDWDCSYVSDKVYRLLRGSMSDLSEQFWAELSAVEIVQAPAQTANARTTVAIISEHTHTKRGFNMHIVQLETKVSKDEFKQLLTKAKELNGWYSRKWENTPGGFAFRNLDCAKEFLHIALDNKTKPTPPTGEPLVVVKNNTAEKLRTMANKMDSAINNKLASRDTNTPRKLKMAQNAQVEGYKLQRAQALMIKMADCIDSQSLPKCLETKTTKKSIMDLVSSKKELIANGYHSYYVCTGEPMNDDDTTKAAWAMLSDQQPGRKDDDIQRKIAALKFSNIAGYYPTPPEIVEQMILHADVQPFSTILEPSAGSGSILDGLDKVKHNGQRYVIERNPSLREVLELKGYSPAGHDFLQNEPEKVDRIIMNPPFEQQQDIDHITHALKMLKDDGILVSICSEAVIFRDNKKTTSFRALLDNYNHEFISLDAGAFTSSGTQVKTQLLIVKNHEYKPKIN